MDDKADVVIVGGGAIGSAIAFFLTEDPGFGGTVTVVERDPTYARASTPLSLGGLRQQFSNRENVEIGLFGRAFVDALPERLSVDGEAPDVGFVEGGYLFCATESGRPVLEENVAVQQAAGADIALLEPDAARARFPWLATDGLAALSLGLSGEGWMDPNALLQAFKRKARSLGARYVEDTVVRIDRTGGRIDGVGLASGKTIACGTLVNAAGAQAGRLAALADIPLPVSPKKRCVFVLDCRETLSPRLPLTIDHTGVFVRPEGKHYVCGVSPDADRDPDTDDLTVEHDQFEEIVWPALAARIPAFEAVKVVGSWAGLYDYNTLDQNGVVGRHPEVENLVFANGFSGHGLQQSPAVGRAVSELIVHGGFRTIDLARFGYERIAAGEPLFEKNVV